MLVKLAETDAEREAVYRLTYREFFRKGYIRWAADERYVHYQGILDRIPQTTILIAIEDGHIVGTNSLTVDSENGLPHLMDFPKQVMRERNSGRNFASSWRIVVEQGHRSGDTLHALIKATIKRGVALGVESWLHAFNPRHALAYMKILNAQVVDFNEHTDGLMNAPALLLRSQTKDLPKHWLYEER